MKPLTREFFGDAINTDGNYQVVLTPKDIELFIKNSEDVEKLPYYVDLLMLRNEEIKKLKPIVERLKKRIEVLRRYPDRKIKAHSLDEHNVCLTCTYGELLKILENNA